MPAKPARLTHHEIKKFACCLCVDFAAASLPAHAEWVTRITDGIMGTRITVELWSEDKPKAEAAIDAVLDEMRHIDESMSTYKPTSEVSQVNAKAADAPMHITKELFDLLVKAKEYSVLTDGAFDITYASVGYMYNFPKHIKPSDAQIAKALPAVDYHHVILDPKSQTVQFSQKGVRIDLGGIAKGYSVDCGIDVLKARGFTRALCIRGRRQPHHRRPLRQALGGWGFAIRARERAKSLPASRSWTPRFPPRAIMSGFSMRAGFATTTSSIRIPAIPPARCAAPPSSDRMRPALTACRRRHSSWGRSGPWKSTTASMISTPSSSSWTAR